ncbi:hypothetical protein BKA70DRAFT_1449268 [Coprinopsis sp. MPI-PUGE-AT-0042]|nr:hypothetical protein BKA70DRAFT_1449268 [Coprinopsis sp. MPI-PUGE-AT-0042]
MSTTNHVHRPPKSPPPNTSNKPGLQLVPHYANLERQLAAQTTSELETNLRQRELSNERLERGTCYSADRETEEREEKEREGDVHDQAKRKTDTGIRTARTLLTALHEEFADLQDMHSALSRLTSQTIASQKSQLTTLNHRRSRILGNLRAQYDELVSQQDWLMQYEAEQEGMGVVREELHRQAEYLRTLEAKNVKLTSELSYLRERNQSIEILREEKRVLERKSKQDGWNARLGTASKTQDTNAINATPFSVPISITQALTDLRLTHAHLLEEHGATAASLRQRTAELGSLESQNAQHQKLLQALEAEIRAAKEDALLASSKAEEAYDDSATPAVDQVKLDKMEVLEVLLAEYNNELEKVEKEKKGLRQTIAEHEQEITAQATKVNEFEEALFDLSGEIAGGRRVPTKTRILCMAENLDQAWVDLRQATMDTIG